MSSDRLFNLIRREAVTLDAYGSQPRHGIVQSVDPATHSAKVLFQPEAVLSGWLPCVSPSVGNNSGATMPYVPGDQVVVMPMSGSLENGVIIGGIYSDSQRPPTISATPTADPTNVQSGEIGYRHASGSYQRYNGDGSVIVGAPGDMHVVGDLYVTGNVYDAHGSLNRLRTHYDQHVHDGVQTGGGQTNIPTQPYQDDNGGDTSGGGSGGGTGGGGSGGGGTSFQQVTPASTWTIDHANNPGYPSVVVTDNGGNAVWADVKYPSDSQVLVNFNKPFAGNAYLK